MGRADPGEQSRRRCRCRSARRRGQLLFANADMPPRASCRATAPAPSSMSLGRPMSDEAIRDLAQRAGIAVEWHDYRRPAENRRARCAAPHPRCAGPAQRHAWRSAGQPQADAAQVHRAGVAAADHRDSGPADAARRRRERTAAARGSASKAARHGRHPTLSGARTAARAGDQRVRLPSPADRRSRDRAGGGAEPLPYHRRCGARCAAVGHRGAGLFACVITATAASATHRASPRSPMRRGSRGADALALSPMHALFGADPVALRSLFAIDAAVPQPAARIAGAGVRRGARGRHVCAPKGWAKRSSGWRRSR